MKNLLITENEKKHILNMYNLNEQHPDSFQYFIDNRKNFSSDEEWEDFKRFEKERLGREYGKVNSQSGDTLETIAKAWNMTIEDIKIINPNISDGPLPIDTEINVIIPKLDFNVKPNEKK